MLFQKLLVEMSALTLSPAKTGLWHPKSVRPAAYSARIAPFHPLAVWLWRPVHATDQKLFHFDVYAIAEVPANILLVLFCAEL
jgi:hypothetical protein